jgi:pre-mRNA-processing factor 17
METFGGRQFIAPPPEMKNVEHTCYNPKRCIHTYKGHTKGVQVIRLFPKFGHLLLSGGLDNKVNSRVDYK